MNIVVSNVKGGVGKTTTAVNLAACVAEAGYDTLLVDIDPQSNATIALGLGKDSPRTMYDVLVGETALDEVIAQAQTAQTFLTHALNCPTEHPARECATMIATLDRLVAGTPIDRIAAQHR